MEFKKLLSEMLGTMLLVLFGCGTTAMAQCSQMNLIGYVATAFAFGLTLTCIITIFGKVSGAHVNPAVSLAMFLDKQITFVELLLYIVAQVIGAIEGAYLVRTFAGVNNMVYGINTMFENDFIKTSCLEMIMTAVFILVILCVSKHKDDEKNPIYIGLALTTVHLFGICFTGTSVNPARTFGMNLIYGLDMLEDMPAFVIGPMLGAVVAWLIFTFIINQEKEEQQIVPVQKKSKKKMNVVIEDDKQEEKIVKRQSIEQPVQRKAELQRTIPQTKLVQRVEQPQSRTVQTTSEDDGIEFDFFE
jgi:aquaporin Z